MAMSPRRRVRRIRRPCFVHPQVEPLEDRRLPSTLTYTVPSGNGTDNLLLRRNGNRLDLFDNTILVRRQSLGGLRAVTILGASGEDDHLAIDFASGGLFSLQDGISFPNTTGAAGTDTLTVNGTTADNTVALTATSLTVSGSLILSSGIEQMRVNTLAGADTVTMTGLASNVATTFDSGIDADFDRFSGNLAGNFAGSLTLLHFDDVRMRVRGNFSGQWTVTGSGTVDDLDIDGSVTATGRVTTEDIVSMMVMGDMDGTVDASAGTVTELEIAGSVGATGLVMAEDLTLLCIGGDLFGDLMIHGSGTITDLEVGGSVGGTSTIMSEDIVSMMVMGHMAGDVTVSAIGVPGVGTIETMTVGGDFTGDVVVEETFDTLIVGGSTTGTVDAGDVGTVSASLGISGSPVLRITEAGVRRELVATRVDNGQPTPPSVKFLYFYDSTVAGDPQLAVQVTNTDQVRFDLSLTTSSAGEFDLSRLFAAGVAGIRNVAVEGDVLATVSPRARAFFGLPASAQGGVHLPLDALGAVAAQDNLVADTLRAASLQAVAFGSLTTGGSTILGETATHVQAATVLAPGTATVTANDTFLVPFGEARKVALFLDTGPSTFDVKNVQFADQLVNNASVTAAISTLDGGITAIRLDGGGGSIRTGQPTGTSIISTGPLGDLLLTSSAGIGDVTAPSIFGNIDTNGPIFGTIQTTAGDLGLALRDAGGTIVGTTFISTSQGITGRIISRGNLVSRIDSQREFSGVIAAQGDIGTAYVNAAGQLVRFGGIRSNGQLAGDVVALGNILGDILASSGLSGHVVAKGRAIAGISSSRIGILGNVNVNGNIDAGAAIVSGGVIGDVAGSTELLAGGAVRGILAAKGDINLGQSGSTHQAAIFESATGVNAAAIDAIFTRAGGQPHGFDLVGQDLAGLQLILTDLAALRVGSDGNLTGPVA